MQRLRPILLLVLLTRVVLAADDGPLPGHDSPPWDGETFFHHYDPETDTGFDVPMLGFRLESRRLDTKAEAAKVSHAFTILGPAAEEEVSIELLHNPEALSLERFFDAHLAWMRTEGAAVTRGRAGVRNVDALHLEQPRSPHAFARLAAVFSLGDRILRVTCVNAEDERALKTYRRVLASLGTGKDAR